jgi:hypothetical protein
MAVPTTRDEFKAYCLRKLGAPAIKINVSLQQIDDRVDEALKFWWDYAMDGTERVYYKHLVTATDQTNKYIELPENIVGAVRIFDIGAIASAIDNPFNLNYQIALNELYTIASSSMIPYYTMMTHLELITQLLVGQKPIRYNRISNRLYVDASWDRFAEGSYILVEAFQVIDPEEFVAAYGERLLQNYATALIKQNWANVIGKVDGEQQGGVKINYQKIMDEALADIEKCEQAIMDQNIPNGLFTG